MNKLTDLSLFQNSITAIEGLDALENLQILSVGNNKISGFDNVFIYTDIIMAFLIQNILIANFVSVDQVFGQVQVVAIAESSWESGILADRISILHDCMLEPIAILGL